MESCVSFEYFPCLQPAGQMNQLQRQALLDARGQQSKNFAEALVLEIRRRNPPLTAVIIRMAQQHGDELLLRASEARLRPLACFPPYPDYPAHMRVDYVPQRFRASRYFRFRRPFTVPENAFAADSQLACHLAMYTLGQDRCGYRPSARKTRLKT
jgi:hypothetical protein